MKHILLILSALVANTAFAHIPEFSENTNTAIIADLSLLKRANIPILYSDADLNVGYTIATGAMQQRLSELAHVHGRCGNFEALPEIPQNLNNIKASLNQLEKMQTLNSNYSRLANPNFFVEQKSQIVEALQELKSENIKDTVTWLQNYPTRYNRGAEANKHVNDFSEKLKSLAAKAAYPVTVELISHRNTPQKSIRVSIKGTQKPDEFIVLGGHLDSIVGWGGSGRAPGADDNASGSANLYETLRVLITKPQPNRTVEFFWYAGEESGLLGSAEIAETYKTEKKNVIAALQLDMTLFPGDGEFRIANMTDFTSAWLRDYLKAINIAYLNVEIIESKCGYGCSDHASWHKRGFPALFPTEASFDASFQKIHTANDVINPTFSFEHSLVFAKIALIMAMDLANSELKQPIF